MKYKINIFINLRIKNFIKNQKLIFFVFFYTKQQKISLKTLQQLFSQSFKISKFQNNYFQNILKNSIFSTLIPIFSNNIYLCNYLLNKHEKNKCYSLLNNIKVVFLLFENFIYNTTQLKRIINFNYYSYIVKLFFYFKFFLIHFFLFNKHLKSK